MSRNPISGDAVLEVNIGSGYRTPTEILIAVIKSRNSIGILPGKQNHNIQGPVNLGITVSWEWDFGDGTPNGTTSIVTHPYTLPGIYIVALTVTDNNGVSDSTTRTIDLSAPGCWVQRNHPCQDPLR